MKFIIVEETYKSSDSNGTNYAAVLLLLSHFSRVRLCATPQTEAHQAPPSPGFQLQRRIKNKHTTKIKQCTKVMKVKNMRYIVNVLKLQEKRQTSEASREGQKKVVQNKWHYMCHQQYWMKEDTENIFSLLKEKNLKSICLTIGF